MGCHTWFCRPLTGEEFDMVKDYAVAEIEKIVGHSGVNIESGAYDKHLYDMLMKSFNEDIPCVDGQYYWELGYGTGNPKLLPEVKDKYIHTVNGEEGLYIDIFEYFDIFRVGNYPKKVIHSRRELRRWLGKKYFKLGEAQLEKISEFFRNYPGGVIIFG